MKKLFLIALLLFFAHPVSAGFVVDHTNTNLSSIPDEWITAVKNNLHIAYNHTSHGSQLITGMNALESYPAFSSKYSWVDNSQGDNSNLSLDDLGIPGIADLSQGDADSDSDGIANWAEDTYAFLNNSNNNHINVIMWSWCNIAGHDITMYLDSMEWLIAQFSEGGTHSRASTYPVQFVFMTAHANGGGEGDSSDIANEQIRLHVASHDRILFDFSDIENYDPDENYYLDKLLNDALYYDSDSNGSRDANWASEYLVRHDDGELDRLTTGNNVSGYGGASSCAHSDGPNNEARLNCVLKGRAAWYLYARLAGWDGQGGGPAPCSSYNGDQSSCEANSCTYCSQAGTCGNTECCQDQASLCSSESQCGDAGYNWCDGACQEEACPVCTDFAGDQSGCENYGCTYCSGDDSCGASACCQDQAGSCSTEQECTSEGYNWCDGTCQADSCPIDPRFDVDQDAQINTSDAVLVLRNSLGLSMSETSWQEGTNTGDTNCDGNSNTIDALLILRNSLGLDMSGTQWCG